MELSMAGGAGVKRQRNASFDEAWPILQEAVNKLIASLEIEGLPNNKPFTSEDYMLAYTLVYNVACAKPCSRTDRPDKKLYDQYQRIFDDYISSKVLPSIRGKQNEILLKELLRRWDNHKLLTRWLSRFFHYLSRYYIPINGLPSLLQTSYLTFYNRVYGEIKDQVSDAITSLFDREREGEHIDQVMVKKVLDIFEEIGEDSLKNYAERIETVVKRASFYSNRDHKKNVLKVKQCCEKETTNVLEYLKLTNNDKLLEVYGEIRDKVCDAMLSLAVGGRTRATVEHRQIKQAILKRVQDIFKEIGDDTLKIYAKDIEEALVEATALFYSKKALNWIATKSYEDFMLKVEECLEKEKSRLSDYLKPTIKNRVLEVVQHELLNVHADKLEEMKAASSRFTRSKL